VAQVQGISAHFLEFWERRHPYLRRIGSITYDSWGKYAGKDACAPISHFSNALALKDHKSAASMAGYDPAGGVSGLRGASPRNDDTRAPQRLG